MKLDFRAEWIRTGTVWSTVEENIKQVRQAGLNFSCNTSIGGYNVIRLPELLEELYQMTETKVNPKSSAKCLVLYTNYTRQHKTRHNTQNKKMV